MSTPIRSQGAARYEDILALPDNVVGEIVDGELYVSPRPASPHAVAASILSCGPSRSSASTPTAAAGSWFPRIRPRRSFGPSPSTGSSYASPISG